MLSSLEIGVYNGPINKLRKIFCTFIRKIIINGNEAYLVYG